jgi:hypothetical protein
MNLRFLMYQLYHSNLMCLNSHLFLKYPKNLEYLRYLTNQQFLKYP